MSTQGLPDQQPAPEPSFWKRFSPNHELPLSTASSVVLHMLFVLLVALFGVTVLSDQRPPLPEMGSIVFHERGDEGPDGGGGSNRGNSLRPFAPHDLPEAGGLDVPTPTELSPLLPSIRKDKDVNPPARKSPEDLLQKARLRSFSKHGAPGSMGGGMSGHGPTIGDDGWFGGRRDTTRDRMQRWTLHFDYSNGDDYLSQLRSLGAMIAVPYRDSQHRLYRDLGKRPAVFELVTADELTKLKRIHWATEDPEAIQSLAYALGIDRPPEKLTIFFPQELEEDLARKEKAAAGSTDIGKIKQTFFKVTRRGRTCTVQANGQEMHR